MQSWCKAPPPTVNSREGWEMPRDLQQHLGPRARPGAGREYGHLPIWEISQISKTKSPHISAVMISQGFTYQARPGGEGATELCLRFSPSQAQGLGPLEDFGNPNFSPCCALVGFHTDSCITRPIL